MTSWPTWRVAMREALYGAGGFYRSATPSDHFRTSVSASAVFARAIAELARRTGARAVTDIGAGRGDLLRQLAALDESLTLRAVEIRDRPAGLPASIEWLTVDADPGAWTRDEMPTFEGLVVANEWLDNVPVEVVEVDARGQPRYVHVDPISGREEHGAVVVGEDARWLEEWWPVAGAEPGSRAEIGRSRDEAWAQIVQRLQPGSTAVAIDYGHLRSERPPFGALAAFREGAETSVIPDGTRDITCSVAVDSIRAAALAAATAGAASAELRTQRETLRDLGVTAGRPPIAQAHTDPSGYLAALTRASLEAELIAPSALGDFWWLTVGIGREGATRPEVEG